MPIKKMPAFLQPCQIKISGGPVHEVKVPSHWQFAACTSHLLGDQHPQFQHSRVIPALMGGDW
jgi:hypothetical protein